LKLLFDEGVPLPLRNHLFGHQVDTVQSRRWRGKPDAEILTLAETDRYEVFVTTDRNMVHQQNLKHLAMKIYALPTTSWPQLREIAAEILKDIEALAPGRENLEHDNVDE